MSYTEIAEKHFISYEKKNVDFKDEDYCFKYGSWVQDAYIAGYLKALREIKKKSNKLKKNKQ